MPGLYFDSGIDKGFENDLARMNRKLNDLSRNTVKQGDIMNRAFKGVASAAAGVVSVMAVGRAGKELITFSKDLETALIEVATISRAVTNDFEGYKNQLIALSTESDKSAKVLTEAYYDIVSAGYDGAAGMELLRASEQASVAGFVDVGIAADGLTTVLNAWGKSAEEAAQVSDIFFKTVEKGKTTFPELGSNIAQVAPLAASMGVSFEEVQAAVATLTKQGTPTAQAFTQIRSALVAMGEQLDSTYFETNTLQDGFEALRKKAEDTGKTIPEVTGRVEGALAVLATTGNNAKVAAEDLNAMNEALGATAKAAEQVKETTEYQINNLKNNILAAFAPLGEEFNLIFGEIAASLNEAFQSGDIERYAKIVLQLIKIFAAYKVSVIALNQVKKIQQALTLANEKAMRISAQTGKTVTAGNLLMAKSFKTLKTAFLSNPIGLIVAGLTAAIPLIKNVAKSFESSGSKIKKINEEIEKAFAEETSELKVLQDQLNDNNLTIERKKELIAELNEKYAEYLPNLLDENSSIEDINAALTVANERLREQIRLKVLNQKATETATKIYELEAKIQEASDNKLIQGADLVAAALQTRLAILKTNLQNEKEAYDIILQQINEASINALNNAPKVTASGQPVSPKAPVKKELTDAERDNALKELEEYHQKRINLITKEYGFEEKKEKEFQNNLLDEEISYLKKRLALTKDNLEKLQIQHEIINRQIEKDKLNKDEDLTEKELKQLEVARQKTINELTKKYKDEVEIKELHGEELKKIQDQYQKDLIEADIKYLQDKLKLTTDELEKLAIEYQIYNKQMQLNGGDDNSTDSVKNSFSQIANEFSNLGDDLVNQLANLSSNTAEAFETLNDESSSTSDKISGIISLIIAAGELIKDIVTNIYTDSADEQIQINKELANRISAETTINRLVRERQEMELNQSAFLDANYKDRYALALKQLDDSEAAINSSLAALSQNLVLTATGNGKSWLGINKTAEEYSFTLAQILDQTDTLSGVELGGTISNILDPADLFGGAASGEAYQDAFKQVKSAFESTLKSMGKTSADMANFSSEEWADFYTILDEGGYITDQGTKALVDNMKEAQEAYTEALETMRGIINEIAGSLGNALGDSLVDANGTDALDNFKKSLNDVFIEMAKAQVNSLFFQSLFDNLQAQMEASMGVGGDQDWTDDLLDFYDQLPGAINNAENFLKDFDAGLQDLGFEGITGNTETNPNLSTAGAISQQITEETGTILAGHFGAVRLSNERIANISADMLDLAVQNLVTLNKIKENTDYLPEIASNTKKTYQKLGGV